MSNVYDKLSKERKKMQAEGVMPEWYTTGGWQLFKNKYLYQADNPKEQYQRIASTLAVHTKDPNVWKEKFFNLLWKGWLSPSTPVLSNTGTCRGLPVACSGNYLSDCMYEIYKGRSENAMLTKYGFGTASYLGDIRPRGSIISVGGTAEGVIPIIEGAQKDMEYVAQGTARRGSWAGYLPIDHGDFDEVCTYLEHNPDGCNIGWNISDEFVESLIRGDEEAVRRFQKAMKTKMITGKGYFFFPDKANRQRPEMYVDKGLDVKAPQLCVAPETLILTDKGYKKISALEDDTVNVWNGEEFSEVVVKKTGTSQELLKVETSAGFYLECTPEHIFYTPVEPAKQGKTKQVAAKDLEEGTKLIKLKTPVIEGEKELDLAYQNGFYTGDGCTVKGKARIYLYGEKRKLIEYFPNKLYHYIQPKQDREYFYVEGLQSKYFVPCTNYTVSSRVKWFEGLMDSDGCVTRNGDSQSLQICSVEEGFLEEVQLMLQTLGVQSKVVHKNDAGAHSLPANDGTGELKLFNCKACKRLLISGMGIVTLQGLGFSPNRLKLTDHVPNRDAAGYVKVTKVVDTGRVDDTFCFTEPKKHMGVFNGLLTGQCNEILLHSSEKYTYTCTLSSMNIAKYDEWKDTEAVQEAIVFLDCVVQEFIERAKNIPGLEKAVDFTRKGRPLGLGVCGLHTYYQQNMIPFESYDAFLFNRELFKGIRSEADKATRYIAETWGEPEWCKGYGVANTHLLAVAPTKSTALIMGGISEGINPDAAMVYTQRSAGGEVDRVNPILLGIMKERGVNTKKVREDIRDKMGSVQHVDWLSPQEKYVFRTGFEMCQFNILQQAGDRGERLDQWQSLNLLFKGDADGEYISAVHTKAFLDERIIGLYYVNSTAGVQASKDECEACQ